jgi:spermidine synthase
LKRFTEDRDYAPLIPIREKIFDARSKYQHIEVYKTVHLGNMLVLDGAVQTTEVDEFIYHESIALPAMALSDNPSAVLIIGGGDGGVAKEVFRACRKVDVELVEIDPMVIETSRKFLPEISSAIPRVKIRLEDGVEFVRSSREKRDVIIADSTDPTPLAEGLFSEEFYRNAAELCDVFVAQTESPIADREAHKRAINNMKKAFEHVYTYYACIPTYPGALFSFTLGLKKQLNVKDIDIKAKYYSKERFLSSIGLIEGWMY